MPVSLQVTNGPSSGMRIHVARGLVVKIGKTDWADYSFSRDSSMADIHFSIHTDGPECQIRDLSAGAGTFINEAPIKEASLRTGDVVRAGRTAFSVVVEGQAAPAPAAVPAVIAKTMTAEPVATDEPPALNLDKLGKLKISDRGKSLLVEQIQPEDYLASLVENELFTDGIRFLAFWLPKPVAVKWACDSFEKLFDHERGAKELQAFAAAREWAADPTEAHRRAAEKAASASSFNGPESWLALGAFWSGGSLAAPELPVVPPGESLTAEAITGAFMLAATKKDPQLALDRYQAAIAEGRELLSKS